MEPEYFESLYPDTAHFAQIEKIVSFVKTGKSCQIIGLPGTGRSTLLSLLAHNRAVRIKHLGDEQKTFHFVLTNFSEIRKRPLFDVMKFLFLNLTESLRERKMLAENKAVGDIFREHLKFQDELILFQGFKEAIDYLCLDKKITVVFLFDRFEEYIPVVTAEFFTNLRTLRGRGKYKFSIVFSVYRALETFLEPSLLSDYYEFVSGNIVYLPLADRQTTDFRVSYIEKITNKKVSKKTFLEIEELTGGMGRLIKLSVEAVLAHGESSTFSYKTPKSSKNPLGSKKVLDKNLKDFLLTQRAVKTALLEMWSVLTQAEQAELLQEKFDNHEVDLYLEEIGLVKERKIQIPLFEEFIKTKPGSQQGAGKIIYDQNTNSIRKEDDILSDQLTALEFRLLFYLLQNSDRIVERDELINFVWADNKSTAGITDQAVDQLIFRLRRKIEEDANNPVHLLTVKGRGFRFVG